MGALTFFPDGDNEHATVARSQLGVPDGSRCQVKLQEGLGQMILWLRPEGSESGVEVAFTAKQAIAFAAATQSIIRRLGLDNATSRKA